MTAWLIKSLGLSKLGARIIVYVLLPLLLVAILLFSLNAWGDSRYEQGKDDADLAWKAAGRKLIEQSEAAAQGANDLAVLREAEYQQRLREEKEAIDAATIAGDDPLDVLF